MARVAFKMKLFPGKEEEYKRRHDNLWPEVKSVLHKNGVVSYSIFHDTDTNALFAVLQVDDPARLDELPKDPVIKKWWAYMSDIMETNPDNSPVTTALTEVFYLP